MFNQAVTNRQHRYNTCQLLLELFSCIDPASPCSILCESLWKGLRFFHLHFRQSLSYSCSQWGRFSGRRDYTWYCPLLCLREWFWTHGEVLWMQVSRSYPDNEAECISTSKTRHSSNRQSNQSQTTVWV